MKGRTFNSLPGNADTYSCITCLLTTNSPQLWSASFGAFMTIPMHVHFTLRTQRTAGCTCKWVSSTCLLTLHFSLSHERPIPSLQLHKSALDLKSNPSPMPRRNITAALC